MKLPPKVEIICTNPESGNYAVIAQGSVIVPMLGYEAQLFADGWNAAIDKVIALNQRKAKPHAHP